MRKEVLWAIIAGVGFGLVIAFGAWRINSSLNKQNKKADELASPKPKDNSEFKISLNKPENEDVVTEDTVMVSGITKPLSWITVSGETGDYISQADEKGIFEEEVDLSAGVNQIKITAFDPAGATSIEKVLVVYSSSFEKRTTLPEATESSDSASTIREKVQAKVEELLNKPKAYLGVVTDIADSTIQVRTKESEIRQISVLDKDEVTVVKDDGKTTKVVKFTDIAIGDFIVAMGYKNGNQVLSAQRILITPTVTEPKIDVVIGISENILTTLKPTAKTQVFSFDDEKITKIKSTSLEDDDQIIYVATEVNSKASIRTIFTLPQN